ncbi:MAG: hypothetical protein OdinLCB4_005340 [Candidatus Odinarchaeum yellowstonii]|uniref:Uncharacterized protein n=1 Tax=Odinarchaeota yellowstonii (strain LCB_4) TaxID=1841599 RepID=A0AAF0IAT5_ODILC|nr:MAG: hypothetical protein OdinLCB4_005340 [Candidatus Odinarchaeum yellowstonii]
MVSDDALAVRKIQREIISHAYSLLISKSGLNTRTVLYSLSLIARLLEVSGIDLGEIYFWAAAFIASHKPNHRLYTSSLEDYCLRNNLDRGRLEEALQEYVEKLKLIIFPDNGGTIFYIDRDDILFSVISAAARSALRKAVLKKILGLEELDLNNLAEDVTKYLIENLRLLPPEFNKSCSRIVKAIFREESST